jgi:HAMP domain-containing protein/CheY-like chemotaxis protein/signal transduction histidine kinase
MRQDTVTADAIDAKRLYRVLSAYENGDFTVRMPVDHIGMTGKIYDALNHAIDLNQRMAKELARISSVVGKAGNVRQRASLPSASGEWLACIDSVNTLVTDLVQPNTEVARVIGAVAKGDLSQAMALEIDDRPLTGEFLRTAKIVNTMVEQLGTFASEVTRVAREVGTEGKLGGQAKVKGVAGTWKDLTDNVNFMANNLTSQVRNIAEVTTAVANGDLSKKITVDVRGEILELKNTMNTMVDQLGSFASEVTRVAREVGTEGKLGGQAQVRGVGGTWKDLTENVNAMAGNLTVQLRDVSKVATAIAGGDLTQKITVDARGEILQIKDVFNRMVDQLGSFASEVTRVAKEVGTEGKLGGQADVRGVAGTWKDLTDNVNFMANNLTDQVRNIAEVTTAVAKGDLSKKITVDVRGEILELKVTINTMVDQLSSFASEVTRVAKEVGSEGKLGGQAEVRDVAGTWKDLTDNVNAMAGNLTVQLRDVAKVAIAIAQGDLTQKITVDVKGELLQIKDAINTMLDQLNAFASEVTRVAREVGTEGKLGGQAEVRGVAGTWKDLTDNVNFMASNLTGQVRNIAAVTTAVANGDLSKKITVDVRGEILELKITMNTMVDQLGSFASEVTRVAREVGTEGKLGGQADVKGVAGTWKDLTDNVNFMASNLTSQVRNIADVTTAVANGDLSKKITVDVRGEILELKNTINTMVDQLSSFASEVTRVAKEVGTEGKLGGQADVKGVAGTWKDLTDNVNAMAGNLTVQLRDVSKVATAIAGGDLTQQITVEAKGEILQIKDVINRMVGQLGSFASEVTRVAKEVGTEGKLGGQAEVKGVAGTWKDLTDNVNAMASNLTNQVRNIADVTTAVATGDLSRKITVDVRGEILELKNTINTMVDQLSSFAAEVTRVAREVGTEGKLGGQADVKGVAGTWKDLTDNVNFMASNLTGQVRNIADVTTAVANGDLSKKITVDVRGEILELKNTINTMVDQLGSFASEVTRVAREVGTEGKLGGQAVVRGVGGTWKDLTDNVNFMANNLTNQVRNIAAVTTAVATGDLSKKITVDVRGEILELKNTINTMVDQLSTFASEVTRVAREVGTEGKLGGQAEVKGVAGTWKDLTDNVNFMADNLTNQVRGIARVVTDVATGNLKRKLVLDAKGEIEQLAETINGMIDTLATFADQVTTVAREVGIEGKLGGQASVPGAAGTWRDLTDNVNRLAANLTTQVRAIADVATAVTKGDLSQTVAVDAAGEVAALKDNINEMILNLKDTTQKNTEQDWLKTNLAKFTRLLQGQRDLLTVSRTILSELAPLVAVHHGVFYMNDSANGQPEMNLLASYAYSERKHLANRFRAGEGLVGQCALEKTSILLTNVPSDYVQIRSGLGEAAPLNIVVLPVLFEGEVKAVIELASFYRFSDVHLTFLNQLTESIGIVLNTIVATMRTEELLKQSQSLATELQTRQRELTDTNTRLEQQARTLQVSEERLKQQQEELQQTNEELEEKAELLSKQNREVERKNQEIELARAAIEEKAEQLALTSKYKSEFLANMSHELRTPLNSLLILSKILSQNAEGNLTDKQTEFARTIFSSGSDLLELINEILDLSKIESGAMDVDTRVVSLAELRDYVERSFNQMAADKGLTFTVAVDPKAGPSIETDARRLQQVLKNLLSNALKFTEKGSVELSMEPATSGWSRDQQLLNQASHVLAFRVTDTGIGIPAHKHRIIFEAFQQADGTTSRRFGGTGLGLSISREIARLLGGEIKLISQPGVGSTFTLYLPGTFDREARQPREDAPPRPRVTRPRREAPSSAEPAEAFDLSSIATEVADDRDSITAGDRVLLIVENDLNFAPILLDAARQKGFKGIVATRGDVGLAMARQMKPDAITLDIELPELDGWSVLDRLKHDPATRHIPVHIISVTDEVLRGLKLGAIAHLSKPVTPEALESAFTTITGFIDRKVKNLLVVEDNDVERNSIVELIGNGDVRTTAVATGAEALAAMEAQAFDCVVLDLGLSDISGFTLLETMRASPTLSQIPVIVYTGKDLTKKQETELRRVAETIIIKDVKSLDRLLDETALFLHRVEGNLPEPKRKMLEHLHNTDPALSGKKVLVVDDDIRNIFALTSVLEQYQMDVVYAENGKDSIELLNNTPDVDAVLMDVMMPEMDGFEAMRAIRRMRKFKTLPIIAVTAKAMKGDREKCIEAGASDYITKPVDTEQLISLLRVWLYK